MSSLLDTCDQYFEDFKTEMEDEAAASNAKTLSKYVSHKQDGDDEFSSASSRVLNVIRVPRAGAIAQRSSAVPTQSVVTQKSSNLALTGSVSRYQ